MIAGLDHRRTVLMSDHADGGQALRFTTYLVSDATAAFEWQAHDGRKIAPEEMHYHALSAPALHGEFAEVVTTVAVLGAV